MAGQADHAVAKIALEGATRQLAREFGRYRIRVNAVRIGWLWGAPLATYFQHQSETTGITVDELKSGVAQRISLGVIPPDEECAKTALMFLSDYTTMVSGATLDVNGGEYLSS